MTDKQYALQERLMADKSDKLKINAIRLRLEEMESNIDVGAVSYKSDGSIKQKKGNGQENKFIEYIDDKEKLQNEFRELIIKTSSNERWKKELIDTLDDSRLYAIASMLFISYKTYEQIVELGACNCEKTVQRKKYEILDKLSLNVQ